VGCEDLRFDIRKSRLGSLKSLGKVTLDAQS
jgi:hypothetical protein